jgi:serine/threonine protein kinase
MTASTLTVDLPLSECLPLPPPIPPAAIATKRRSRQRMAVPGPGARIGMWRIERELGRGGMATVYSAAHTRFGKRAALKLAHRAVLGERFTPETFLREARIANLINHPGVVEAFATGTFDGRPYLVMERLTGNTLGGLLDAAPLPRDQAIEILLELCDVLGAAHAAGVVHRDLKLDNVFVLDTGAASSSGGRRVKLLDWGMARIAGEDDPLRGLIAGTLTYVAPEQVRGDDVTPAADVYALGVLAYQLLLGAPPFASQNDLELLDKHLCAVPPRPRAMWSQIPSALEQTLIQMLAKRAEDRPSIDDVARALRTARDRLRPSMLRWFEPPVSHPDVLGRPAVGLLNSRRQRAAFAALGLALTVACVVQLFVS